MLLCTNRGVNLFRCLVSAPSRSQRCKFEAYTTLDKNPFSQPHFLKKPAKRFQMQSYAALSIVWRMRCNFTQVIDGPVVFLFASVANSSNLRDDINCVTLFLAFLVLISFRIAIYSYSFKWKDETDSIFFMHFNSFFFLSVGIIRWSINLLYKFKSFKGWFTL